MLQNGMYFYCKPCAQLPVLTLTSFYRPLCVRPPQTKTRQYWLASAPQVGNPIGLPFVGIAGVCLKLAKNRRYQELAPQSRCKNGHLGAQIYAI